jgi:hypothetical protein
LPKRREQFGNLLADTHDDCLGSSCSVQLAQDEHAVPSAHWADIAHSVMRQARNTWVGVAGDRGRDYIVDSDLLGL